MATTYFESTANADVNSNTVTAPANTQTLTTTAPGSASSVTITQPSSGSALRAGWITVSDDPGAQGGTGAQNYTIKLSVTTANANFVSSGIIARCNSAGVIQTSVSGLTVSLTTTGVKTITANASNLGTFVAGDRLLFQLALSNSAMSVQSAVLEVGLANGNEEVTAPWTLAAAPAIVPYVRSPRNSFFCKALPRSWRERKSGILTPRLWTPAREPAFA